MIVRRARPLYPRAARATHQSVNRERCPSNELPDTLHVIHDGCSIQRRLVIPRPQKGVLHSPRQQRAVTIRVTACSHPRVSLRRGSPQRCQNAGVQLLQQPTMCFTTSSYPPAAARPRGNIPSWGSISCGRRLLAAQRGGTELSPRPPELGPHLLLGAHAQLEAIRTQQRGAMASTQTDSSGVPRETPGGTPKTDIQTH
jgi:hypothetical protein